jgi:hypothetical protein
MSETPFKPLAGVLSSKLFPGRTTLFVHEVAKALSISAPQVIDLIAEGLLSAIEITGAGNKSRRQHWRIPASAYDEYLQRRNNQRELQ